MKHTVWMSAVAALLIFGGCSQQTKEEVKKASQSVAQDVSANVEKAKEKSSEVMDEAKRRAGEAVESVKEGAKKVKEEVVAKTAEAAAVVEKKAADVKKELAPEPKAPEMPGEEETIKKPGEEAKKSAAEAVPPSKDGAALFAKCAGCHGTDGKTKALGKSAVIAGQSSQELTEKLKAYKEGTRNVNGMGSLMKGQMAGLNDAEIAALADYISRMK
jgi:cytochrome c553